MPQKVVLLLGTAKGVFIIESNDGRKTWRQRGPYCDTWPINHAVGDPSDGAIYAGGGDPWFGPAVWKSTDLGESWTHSSDGLAYPPGEEPIKSVWSLERQGGSLYAGVEPAGLFRSDDDGQTWTHIDGLQRHPSRPEWHPGGGGLILHSIVTDPGDPKRLWVGISAAGVFYSEDGGETWEPRNRGTRADFLPEGSREPEFGQCVHSIARAEGGGDVMYQQNHCGMYRSDDGGRQWVSIENGLPSSFGFPTAIHPRDPATVFLLPLNGDIAGRYVPDAKAAVWRSRDGGGTWTDLRQGLPQENAFINVLRQAMTTDRLDPAGVYFGTTSGSLYASADEGDTWTLVAQHLPKISSVETLVVDA